MKTALASLRLILEFGWLYPPLVALSAFAGVFQHLAPLYAYVLLMVVLVAALEIIRISQIRSDWISQLSLYTALGISLVAAALIAITTQPTGPATVAGFIVNLTLLVLISLRTVAVAREEITYQDVVRDFRLGTLGIVLVLLAIYAIHGLNYTHVQKVLYPALIGYVLVGIFGMALGRRFAPDDYVEDQRMGRAEPEWFLSVLLLVGGVAVLGVALTQLFVFDVIGAFSSVIAFLAQVAMAVIGPVSAAIIGFFSWIFHLLGLHQTSYHKHGPTYRPPPPSSGPHKRLYHGSHPRIFETVLEALGIVVVGGVLLFLIALAVRSVHFPGRRPMTGEQRVSTWSWRKLLDWLFRRGRKGLADMVPHLNFRAPRPEGAPTSVREVYRALLRLGRQRIRPRGLGETGLEYSDDLGNHWHGAMAALDHLNALYAAERYGERAESPDTLEAALADFTVVETRSHEE